MPEVQVLPTTGQLLGLVDAMAGQPVVMLVDLVADRFISGTPKRISREAPVLILSYQGERLAPGGGANAVANVAALGGRPLPLGVVGEDMNLMAAYLAAVREFAHSSVLVRDALDQLHDAYLSAGKPGQLPIVTLAGVEPIRSRTSQGITTNYKPRFEIVGWVDRPDDLKPNGKGVAEVR